MIDSGIINRSSTTKNGNKFSEMFTISSLMNQSNHLNDFAIRKSKYPIPIFIIAAIDNDEDSLEKGYRLIENSDVMTDRWNNALHAAARFNNYMIIRKLIFKYNVDVNVRNYNLFTPLLTAFYYGNEACIDELLHASIITHDDVRRVYEISPSKNRHHLYEKIKKYYDW
jgi:ankyrin repeat protein